MMGDQGIYTFNFTLVGTINIEADCEEEAWDEFESITDFSDYVNSSEAFDVSLKYGDEE